MYFMPVAGQISAANNTGQKSIMLSGHLTEKKGKTVDVWTWYAPLCFSYHPIYTKIRGRLSTTQRSKTITNRSFFEEMGEKGVSKLGRSYLYPLCRKVKMALNLIFSLTYRLCDLFFKNPGIRKLFFGLRIEILGR